MNWTAEQDHQNMMDQLGIKALRPGPSGNENAPNHANYDESKANPFPNLPDPLTLKNGKKVTKAKTWWQKRRPEIVEDFEREVYGRVPKSTPSVKWEVTSTEKETNGEVPAITKKLVGHVDNSSYPAITVDIQMTLTLPANATGPAPVMIDFGFDPAFMKQMLDRMKARGMKFPPPGEGEPGGKGPSWQQQLWPMAGAMRSSFPTSVQAGQRRRA